MPIIFSDKTDTFVVTEDRRPPQILCELMQVMYRRFDELIIMTDEGRVRANMHAEVMNFKCCRQRLLKCTLLIYWNDIAYVCIRTQTYGEDEDMCDTFFPQESPVILNVLHSSELYTVVTDCLHPNCATEFANNLWATHVFSEIDDECVICYINSDDPVFCLHCREYTNCGKIHHSFHKECVLKWLAEKGCCPYCGLRPA